MILQKEEKTQRLSKMQKLKITQIKSPIGREKSQRLTLISLGLNKINKERELEDTPSIRGMIEKVKHLVVIKEN